MANDLDKNQEDSSDERTLKRSEIELIADKATAVAVKQYETSVRYKQVRMDEVKKNEDQYYGRVKKPLKGRFNIPVPIMPGFVDTYKAKIDERIALNFNPGADEDYRASVRTQAMWKRDSSPQYAAWDKADRGGKFLGILSGVVVAKIWSESDPHYRNYFHVEDYNDFHCEPMGGQDLEKHLFLGASNRIRTRNDLVRGAKSGIYNKRQVAKLLTAVQKGDYKKNSDIFQNQFNRFKDMGLDPETHNYVGQETYNFVEWGMVFEGVRYYLLFEYETGIWVRFQKLSEVFQVKDGEDELWPWLAWHTNEDPKVFWSKAPADDMRPIADMIRILANQELENRARNNAGMRAYDPNVFKDPSQFQWQPEGLVEGDSSVRPLGEGIYEFKTPQLQGTINLIQWLDTMSGRKTGITSDAQGAAETDKVGINVLNLQQTADRIGLTNKSYVEFHIGAGTRYVRGLRDHLPVGMAVKVLGERGYEWEEFTQKDKHPVRDFDITVTGGSSEIAQNEIKRKDRKEGVLFLLKDPQLRGAINIKAGIEEWLRNASYEDDEVKTLMDNKNFGDKESISEAAQENLDLMTGMKIEPNLNATAGHLQRHLRFMLQKKLAPGSKEWLAFNAHMEAEVPIVIENAARLSMQINPEQFMPGPEAETVSANNPVVPFSPEQPQVPETPLPVR